MNDLNPLDLSAPPPVPFALFPSTRYQGSKRKLLPLLFQTFADIAPNTAADLYCGTGTVSLLLRTMGVKVDANDMLSFNANSAKLLLGLDADFLRSQDHHKNLQALFNDEPRHNAHLIAENYAGIFFLDEENAQIDRFCQNLSSYGALERALYVYCVGQALLMKRPYNLFHRANLVMRTKTVKRSFGNAKTWATPTLEHALKVLNQLKKFPFRPNVPAGRASVGSAEDFIKKYQPYDVVYLDPPYLNAKGQAVDYASFYHFLDGLIDYELFRKRDDSLAHRPIRESERAWMTEASALAEMDRILTAYPYSTVVLSYRSDGRPSLDVLRDVFRSASREIHTPISKSYKYALSHSGETNEAILVSLPTLKKRQH